MCASTEPKCNSKKLKTARVSPSTCPKCGSYDTLHVDGWYKRNIRCLECGHRYVD